MILVMKIWLEVIASKTIELEVVSLVSNDSANNKSCILSNFLARDLQSANRFPA